MIRWQHGILTSEIRTASAGVYISGRRPVPAVRFNLAKWVAYCCASAALLVHFTHSTSAVSDEFDVGAKVSLDRSSSASIQLFRRDNKNRIAAIDTGVPPQAFTPVSILDPGPDGIPGTFDDQQLTVYAQNPATLGHDRYLLTNPAGLRMLDAGLLAEVGTEWRRLKFQASS